MRFKKKPVEVDAIQFITNNEPDSKNMNELVSWVNTNGGKASHNNTDVLVMTSKGELVVSVGSWIIKGVAGEFYPCKPEIFEQTYDKVE